GHPPGTAGGPPPGGTRPAYRCRYSRRAQEAAGLGRLPPGRVLEARVPVTDFSRRVSPADHPARLDALVAAVRARSSLVPRLGIVLGSGLGGLASDLVDAVSIPFGSLPGWPAATAPGHTGALLLGSLAGTPVVMLQGRFHLYEGNDAGRGPDAPYPRRRCGRDVDGPRMYRGALVRARGVRGVARDERGRRLQRQAAHPRGGARRRRRGRAAPRARHPPVRGRVRGGLIGAAGGALVATRPTGPTSPRIRAFRGRLVAPRPRSTRSGAPDAASWPDWWWHDHCAAKRR